MLQKSYKRLLSVWKKKRKNTKKFKIKLVRVCAEGVCCVPQKAVKSEDDVMVSVPIFYLTWALSIEFRSPGLRKRSSSFLNPVTL